MDDENSGYGLNMKSYYAPRYTSVFVSSNLASTLPGSEIRKLPLAFNPLIIRKQTNCIWDNLKIQTDWENKNTFSIFPYCIGKPSFFQTFYNCNLHQDVSPQDILKEIQV